MTPAEFTVPLPTLRFQRTSSATPTGILVANIRPAMLVLGCTTCGSKWHGRLACPMAIEDEKVEAKP